jgi:hypothetical protein
MPKHQKTQKTDSRKVRVGQGYLNRTSGLIGNGKMKGRGILSMLSGLIGLGKKKAKKAPKKRKNTMRGRGDQFNNTQLLPQILNMTGTGRLDMTYPSSVNTAQLMPTVRPLKRLVRSTLPNLY